MSASEKVLSRIKKLMALADNTGNVHEAAVALRQAQALMMKYGVAPEAVELAEITSETCRNIPSNALSVPGWLNALVTVVCMIAGCRSYYGWYQHSDRKKRRSVTFYGIGERPAVACYLFGVVCRQLKRDAEHYLHTACTHPLLKLSTIRRRMDEYRLATASVTRTGTETLRRFCRRCRLPRNRNSICSATITDSLSSTLWRSL